MEGNDGRVCKGGAVALAHGRTNHRTSVRTSFVAAGTTTAPLVVRLRSHASRGEASGPCCCTSARDGPSRYASEEVSQDMASERQPTTPGWGGGRENVSCPYHELRHEKKKTSAHQGQSSGGRPAHHGRRRADRLDRHNQRRVECGTARRTKAAAM